MATTIGKLIELLSVYPSNFKITNEQNQDFIHIVNIKDDVILSVNKPIGICQRSGGYVYPSVVDGYDGFSPELDEDVYNIEFTKLDNL
jgi:hypothetical protein